MEDFDQDQEDFDNLMQKVKFLTVKKAMHSVVNYWFFRHIRYPKIVSLSNRI